MTEESIIKAENVTVSFGDFQALKGIDAEIKQGEIIVILGPSGSGKSTFIRTLNQLQPHDGGRIEVDGIEVGENTNISDMKRLRTDIGFVFQQFNLFPHLTVLENIALAPQKVKGMKKQEAEQIAIDLLDKVGIPEQKNKYAAELSGGQQQRVAIARALAMDPKIMLFDEVTSALDPELVDEVLTVLRKLASDSDTTMLTVTHEMNFAREFADRVLFFDSGQIVESGKPESIFSNPTKKRTKEFLKKFINNVN